MSEREEARLSIHQAKWQATREKVEFLKQFPGLVHAWEDTLGQTVQSVIPLDSDSGMAVVVFSSGNFVIAPAPEIEPKHLRRGIEAARRVLEQTHHEAYARYERLADLDKQATRQARLENVLGAIHNNMESIPELKDRIRSLVKEWDS